MKRSVGFLSAAALLICGLASAHAAPVSARDATAGDLALGVSLDQSSYAAGSSIRAVATITNRSSDSVKYLYSARTFSWQIVDPGGHVVYDASVGRAMPMFVMIRTLEPGKSATYPNTIPVTSQDGSLLAPGTYTLQVRMNPLNISLGEKFTVVSKSSARPAERHPERHPAA